MLHNQSCHHRWILGLRLHWIFLGCQSSSPLAEVRFRGALVGWSSFQFARLARLVLDVFGVHTGHRFPDLTAVSLGRVQHHDLIRLWRVKRPAGPAHSERLPNFNSQVFPYPYSFTPKIVQDKAWTSGCESALSDWSEASRVASTIAYVAGGASFEGDP